jgi:hypothetical protein
MALAAIERARIEEAVETLARYNRDPFLDDFIKQQPPPTIPLRHDKDYLCEGIIKKILLGEAEPRFRKHVVTLPALVEYLDRLQETGRQHVYLFRLADEQLAAVRDVNAVRKRIGGDDALYSGGIVEWEARKGPRLVQVRHDVGTLVLKWIETREYWITHEEEEVTENQKVQVKEKREERAASYFVVDLGNGDSELRIQAIHGEAQAARLRQLATYRELIAKHLALEPIGPAVLAPAIRRALIEREIKIASCEAILPNGGRFIGRREELPPVDIRKLQAGITIAFDRAPPVGGVCRIELDGRLDEIFIRSPLVPEEHRRVVERVRWWRRDGIAFETIAEVDDEKSERGIDRAIREYVETHLGVVTQDDPRIREQFLAHIREVAQAERAEYEREIALVQADERCGSMLFLIAVSLALMLFSVGAFLLFFFPPMMTIGKISGLLSLLSGGGTALLRWYTGGLKAKRAAIEERQRDSRDTALLIQAAMSHAEPSERSAEISKVTQLLIMRVARTPSSLSRPKIPVRAGKRSMNKRKSATENGTLPDG